MTLEKRTNRTPRPEQRSAYTLLEVILAIGLVAILLGITVPMISGAFGASEVEQIEQAFTKSAQAARNSALDQGEARRFQITKSGLVSAKEDIPGTTLPAGWNLQIRRMTDGKFRRPEKNEFWEFNSAGICEPVAFLLGNGSESATLTFDPLTALVLPDEQ
jgi:type II secretory pathway pseudopilin PulG